LGKHGIRIYPHPSGFNLVLQGILPDELMDYRIFGSSGVALNPFTNLKKNYSPDYGAGHVEVDSFKDNLDSSSNI